MPPMPDGRPLPIAVVAAVADTALPGAGALTDRLLTSFVEERRRNASRALQVAEAVSGMTREAFTEQLEENPELLPLVTRLLHAAGMTGHDATLRGMGAALGQAMRGPDLIDECELILGALTDLTPLHTELLRTLCQDPPGDRPNNAWVPTNLFAMTSVRSSVAPLVLGGLVGRGLARHHGGGGLMGESLSVTELGRTVLQMLDVYDGQVY